MAMVFKLCQGASKKWRRLNKTGNILNKLPKGLQNKAKGHLQDIWMAETRNDAETAFDFFVEAYGPKYVKATACLAKDRDALLSFYDFPAEHWKHVRTTNPMDQINSPRSFEASNSSMENARIAPPHDKPIHNF